MDDNNNILAFLAFVKAGLWEKDARLSEYEQIDLSEVYRLAEEQSVVGLVAAGLERVVGVKFPKEAVLQFVGQALRLEQQNQAMNAFIGKMIIKLRAAGICTLLVKGQGIAQCYDKPLWRACGDVDFYLDVENYKKAKAFLVPLAKEVKTERVETKHLEMTIDNWVVELHGTLHSGLSMRLDRQLDNIMQKAFSGEYVRVWLCGGTQIALPRVDEDVVYVFTHILQHFYKGGIGLRQVCDWMRLLWTFRESIDRELLENRLIILGLLSEWKAFGAFAVYYLGMPSEAMPFYSPDLKWKQKADKICSFIMKVGNFGQNRDNSYYRKPYIVRKAISFFRRCGDLCRHMRTFPKDSLRFFPNIFFAGLKAAIKREG